MYVSRSGQFVSRAVPFERGLVRSSLLQRTCVLNRHLILIACFGLLSEISWAQENPVTPETEQKPQAVEQAEPPGAAKVEAHSVSKLAIEKRKKATAGIAAIGGIAILGIGAIAMTMLWARRLRRLARDMGPAQTTEGNDFWFLKPPKPLVSEHEISEGHRPLHQPPPTDTPDTPETKE